ncbi:type I-C CRISPR-associated protein Cas8c/Csd1 [Endozoicomonas ascidiicola]|uniref:type I-C CRISPR-associated protein Cas8c/Csd1 n=1 Tax=Endozoicomonas ascidiicola TaxID=1698521 RepID=UPI003CCC344A
MRRSTRAVNFKKLLGNLSTKLDHIPPYLKPEQQCQFAIGYYHQQQAFYPNQTNNNEDSEHEKNDATTEPL